MTGSTGKPNPLDKRKIYVFIMAGVVALSVSCVNGDRPAVYPGIGRDLCPGRSSGIQVPLGGCP